MQTREFLMMVRVEAEVLYAWVEAGWLAPRREGVAHDFSEVDVARAQLIRDLTHDLGVNDEGIPVILDLVDQLHGLRRTLRDLLSAIGAQPDDQRRRIVDEIRQRKGSQAGNAVREAAAPKDAEN